MSTQATRPSAFQRMAAALCRAATPQPEDRPLWMRTEAYNEAVAEAEAAFNEAVDERVEAILDERDNRAAYFRAMEGA